MFERWALVEFILVPRAATHLWSADLQKGHSSEDENKMRNSLGQQLQSSALTFERMPTGLLTTITTNQLAKLFRVVEIDEDIHRAFYDCMLY